MKELNSDFFKNVAKSVDSSQVSSIWKTVVHVEDINALMKGTISDTFKIIITSVEENSMVGEMFVTEKLHQPMGIMNGGASVVFSETLASACANMCVDMKEQYCVGLEVNANHIKPISKGRLIGLSMPVHIGRKTHVWQVSMTNEEGQLICISRVTLSVQNHH